MKQQIRRFVAVAGLTMALLLTIPASSRAADWREPASVTGVMAQAWSWLEGLLGAPAPAHRAASTSKITTSPPPPPPPSDPSGGGQGSMIDPDGVRR